MERPPCATRYNRLCVGGRSWHAAPRYCTEIERLSAGTVRFYTARTDHNQRDTARAQQQSCVLRFLRKDRQRSGALAFATRKLAVDMRPQLACRTTVSHRRREVSRRYSAIMQCMDQSRPAQHGAHARQARVLCLLPRDSQRSDARARATRKLAVHWRPQLACRTTVSHRRREVFRWCSALS